MGKTLRSRQNHVLLKFHAGKLLQEYWEARGWIVDLDHTTPREQQASRRLERWKKPEGDDLKINIDCAFSNGD
ncbi:hypothetical protein K1719_037377 [Acacia pycnantha]|nr:hypothetical protein K1719_037377 [Acacia pycnantha]